MARLTAADRERLLKEKGPSAFGVPSKAPGPGSYPMPDAKHAALAKGFAKRFAGAAKKQIDAKANKKLA